MIVPNVDKPKPFYGPAMRETDAYDQPSDLVLEDTPRYTVRGKVRIPLAIEWHQIGTGFFAHFWSHKSDPKGRHYLALFPYVRWQDDKGRTGRMSYSDFLTLAESSGRG